MKISQKIQIQSLFAACLLLFGATRASASLYGIICVECQLQQASYTLQNSSSTSLSGPVIFPSAAGDFQFNVFGQLATAYNSSFFYNTGTYSFATTGNTTVPSQSISMTVNPGQIGMFFNLDWNSTTSDVLNVFNVKHINGDTIFTPVDVDGNGVVGFNILQGPYPGLDLSLNFTVTTVPLPAAFGLFASAIPVLLFFARRRKV